MTDPRDKILDAFLDEVLNKTRPGKSSAEILHHVMSSLGELKTTGTIADPDPHLDQFMVIERGLILGEQRVAEAGVAHHDQRLELVAEAAQVLLLVFTEVHGRAG